MLPAASRCFAPQDAGLAQHPGVSSPTLFIEPGETLAGRLLVVRTPRQRLALLSPIASASDRPNTRAFCAANHRAQV